LKEALQTARTLIPAVLIGGLTGFALIGPVSHLFPGWAAVPVDVATATARPDPTPPRTTTTPANCYVSGPGAGTPHPAPAAPTPVTAVWVNAPLGVNVRSAPNVNSQKLTALPQGTRATVIGQQTGTDGALWYHVQPAGQATGWANGNFVVPTPIHTVTTGEGWSLMLPDGYTLSRTGSGTAEVRSDHDTLVPFLEVAVSLSGTPSVPAPIPVELRHDVPWVRDHTNSVGVWDYQPTETVSRAAIDSCLVTGAATRADGGWAWVFALSATTTNHQYSFLFISDQADDPLITQVLASTYLG
jgi:Bacterial SH3 domain